MSTETLPALSVCLTMDVIDRGPDAVYLRLPRELWEPVGGCVCGECKGAIGYWDTLAVPTKIGGQSWKVHMPRGGRQAALASRAKS